MWRAGLHQAVEAKDVVAVTAETRAEVSISRQVFYKMLALAGQRGAITIAVDMRARASRGRRSST